MEKYEYSDETEKLRIKLRKMRIIATSLLAAMTVIFIIFKRYEDRGLLYSSIVAFSEASMVGALADWFAVVALFKYPLGLKIIPHTAIIANNKTRIASALSNFVVSNFFTPENIKAKLDKISISGEIASYIESNKQVIAQNVARKLPAVLDAAFPSERVMNYLKTQLYKKADEIKLYPVLANILDQAVKSKYHVPFVKEILKSTYAYIYENKEKTMAVIGGVNKTLALPIIGDLVYKNILDFLLKQKNELEFNKEVEVNKLLYSMLPKLFEDMRSSEELICRGEKLKNDVISSEAFSSFIEKCEAYIMDTIDSLINDEKLMNEKIELFLDYIANIISENQEIRARLDNAINNLIETVVSSYGGRIGSLIYDTMDNWETKDMVDKLEVQVGSDLQYIRINGTVIGGLAGLAIHFLSMLI